MPGSGPAFPKVSSMEPSSSPWARGGGCVSRSPRFPFRRTRLFSFSVIQRRSKVATLILAASLGLAGCRATGRGTNAYFDWGGRVFTTNPISMVPYFIGFVSFFVAGLPLDLFTWIGTEIAWPDGAGEDYQGAVLAPSICMGTTGGTILALPFFPFGLPWWNPDRDDSESPTQAAAAPDKQPAEVPADTSLPGPSGPDPGEVPAGAPRH